MKAPASFSSRLCQSRLALTILVIVALAGTQCSKEPAASTASREPAAARARPGRTLVVGTAPPGAIVTLDPTSPREFAPPTEVKVMDQFGLAFSPSLLLARAGQRVEFRSSEDVLHNVRVDENATNAPVFNVATPPFGAYAHVFEKPGYYDVSCDIHTGMRANILVTSTPYAVLAGDDGAFTFPDVEPASYKLTATAFGRQVERVVNVAGARIEVRLEKF